jgi:hypothetical protein
MLLRLRSGLEDRSGAGQRGCFRFFRFLIPLLLRSRRFVRDWRVWADMWLIISTILIHRERIWE